MTWADLWLRIRALARLKEAEEELDEELQFHLAMQARKNLASCGDDGEAARQAQIQFGGVEKVKEECRTARGTLLIETLWRDVGYALRGFRRAPAFVLTVVATIALGLGLNTTLFTIFDAYVLRPIPVKDAYSLYRYTWTDRAGRGHSFSWREFEEFRRSNPAFSDVLGIRFLFVRVEGHPLMGEMVTGNYFQMLGVHAAEGRTLMPRDASKPGGEPVMVLSHTAWKNKFGGDPDMVGRKLIVHGYPVEVIGIAKQDFTGLGDTPRDFWVPLTMAPQLEDGPSLFGAESTGRVQITGRLRKDLSAGQATAALTGLAGQNTADRPESEKATGALLTSQATMLAPTPSMYALFFPILTALVMVLLIACGNVANMMLGRAMARQREIGIRLSLGAARSRLIRQLLTESVLLAVPAAAAGFLISEWTIQSGVRLMFATMPKDFIEFITVVPLVPDWRVFSFMLLGALVSALLFGLAPAIQATRTNVMQAAKGDFSSDFRPTRLRNGLVIFQITMCVLLLISTGVLLRGASKLAGVEVGFSTRGVIEMRIQNAFRAKVLAELAGEPAVQVVAAASAVPLNGQLPSVAVVPDEGGEAVNASYNFVSPEFFGVLDIPILRGRNFTPEEAVSGAPVALISLATGKKLWPNRDALGQSLRIPRTPNARKTRVSRYEAVRVIGISRDVVSCCAILGPDAAVLYLPTTPADAENTILVRVNGDAESIRQRLDAALAKAAPGAVDEIHRMDELRAAVMYPFTAASWLCEAVGGVALLLTLSGIYGVLSYLVAQRRKEIGIRVAMGATSAMVTGLVLRQSIRLAFIGIGIGAALALVVSRLLASRLVMMDTFDAVAYCSGVLLVLAASAAAAYFPSRRAARIDPLTTLRYD